MQQRRSPRPRQPSFGRARYQPPRRRRSPWWIRRIARDFVALAIIGVFMLSFSLVEKVADRLVWTTSTQPRSAQASSSQSVILERTLF